MAIVHIHVANLVEAKSQALQTAYAVELLHLVYAVIALTCPLVHLVRHQQTFLLVVSQRLYCYLHQL